MMKVETSESGGRIILHVEGRLAGAYVPELEGCCKAACALRPAGRISMDLKGVTFIDRAGRDMLEWMHGHGVELVGAGAGVAVQDILGRITEQPRVTLFQR